MPRRAPPRVKRSPRAAGRTPSAVAPLSVIVLAAGEGKRMKSALPKVLQPLGGRALLSHVLETARRLEPDSIHVVYGHGGERVREVLAAEPVSWVLQAERLGTGHAAQQAIGQIPEENDVLLLYGDVPLIALETLRTLRSCTRGGVGLLTVELPDATGYGRVIRGPRGDVRRVVEEKDASARERRIREANTGVLAAPARLLRKFLGNLRNDNVQREYYLTDVIAMAVKSRIPVRAQLAPDPVEVLGVNDKAQLAGLEHALRLRTARALMLAGVTVADPARLDVRGRVVHGTDVAIDVNVVLDGEVRLGDRVRIGPNCVLRNCEIGPDTEVHASCVLDGAQVGAGCLIGPFARLRPGARLGDRVHIGNFVEVKNSSLAEDAKANHLSYVGDAEIGARVNIGAGTIIANYDGANKHRTVIGADAHTGSNSVLVAPITVGAGATVGAGSTVTREVPAGKLTVARARQVTLERWKRPVKGGKG